MKSILKILVFMLLGIPAGVFAQITHNWDGSAGSDWFDPANWDANSKPDINSNVSISSAFPGVTANNPTIAGNETALAKSIIISGKTLTIADDGKLQVSGTISNSGILEILSSASGTGNLIVSSNATGVSNSYRIQRYLPSTEKWHIISSPVDQVQLLPFATSNNIRVKPSSSPTEYALYLYEENTDDWTYKVTSNSGTDMFLFGEGWAASSASAGVVTFTGSKLNTAELPLDIYRTLNGWNSAGNPYTSSLSVEKFLLDNSVVLDEFFAGIYLWDYNEDNYTAIKKDGHIAVGQGFMVKGSALYTNLQILYKRVMKVFSPGEGFKSGKIAIPEIRLTARSATLQNSIRIHYYENATLGLDRGYDLGKFSGNPDIGLYTRLANNSSQVNFEVQAFPDIPTENLTIPVGMDLTRNELFTFSVEKTAFPADAKIYIEDKLLNKKTELTKQGSVYEVQLSPMKGFGRFNLIVAGYNNTATKVKALIDDLPQPTVSTRGKQIVVRGKFGLQTRIALYGIDGRLWHNQQASDFERNVIDANALPAGIYLVKISQPGYAKTLKVVLPN